MILCDVKRVAVPEFYPEGVKAMPETEEVDAPLMAALGFTPGVFCCLVYAGFTGRLPIKLLLLALSPIAYTTSSPEYAIVITY